MYNNKCYIGYTSKTIQERFEEHCNNDCKRGRSIIASAIKKYSKENFEVKLLDESDDINEIKNKEMFYIKFYNSQKDGYNITPGGDGWGAGEDSVNFGIKRSDDIKSKISKSLTGHETLPETKKKLSDAFKGKSYEEIMKDSSEIEKRKKEASERFKKDNPLYKQENKDKISKSQTGEGNSFYGRTHSLETREKISISTKKHKTGCKLTKEHINKIQETRKRNGVKSNAKTYVLIDRSDNYYMVHGRLTEFCKENKLSYNTIRIHIDKGIISESRCNRKTELRNNTNGWSIKEIK